MLRPDCILFIHFGTAAAYINLDPVAREREGEEEEGQDGRSACAPFRANEMKVIAPATDVGGKIQGF